MEPSIYIRAFDLRCPPKLGAERRRRLATVATRELPAALARAAGSIDDGRLIFVRRLDVRASLRGGSDQVAAARWADAIAVALRDARGDVVVFERPLDALVAFVEAALRGGPSTRIGHWPWVPSVLETIRAALSSLPALDGRSHAYATSPPLPGAVGGPCSPEPRTSIEWSLVTSGALLPSLVARLAARSLAAATLGAITAPIAAEIVDRLIDSAAVPDAAAPVVSRVAAAITAWPSPVATDPRNLLLVAALVLEQRPSLRGTPVLASVRSIAPASASRGSVPVADAVAAATVDVPVATAAALAPSSSVAPSPPASPESAPDSPTPAPRPMGVKTAFAGLLFLLDPLRRLELPAAILDEAALTSDPGLPALLYGTVCRLLPGAWADPCALALADDGAPQAPQTAPTPDRLAAIDRATTRIATAAARLPATPHDADAADAAAHAAAVPLLLPPWLDRFCTAAAARVAAHVRARLGSDEPLAALARKLTARPGTISLTRTHIDVTLDLADVDLDVRRAALDVDPGWVSFLGRIVSFHYL